MMSRGGGYTIIDMLAENTGTSKIKEKWKSLKNKLT